MSVILLIHLHAADNALELARRGLRIGTLAARVEAVEAKIVGSCVRGSTVKRCHSNIIFLK